MLKMMLYVGAYVLLAAVIWGVLGAILVPLASIPLLVPMIALIYALGFGLVETFGLPLRAPSLAWQVPSRWIRGHPLAAQILTWGSVLGPGLVTRNPYAGIWLLPFLIGLNHSLYMAIVIGVTVGIAHGSTRALGVLSNMRRMEANCSHLLILGEQLSWLYRDGLALLLAAGALAAYTLTLLGVHL
jgi:hypothetical protein